MASYFWRLSRAHTVWLAAVGVVILATAVGVTRSGSGRGTAADQPPLIHGGWFEASGVAHVPGSRQFLFVADDEPRDIFIMEITPAGRQRGAATRVPLNAHVTDPEGLTWDGRHFYVVGSQSKLTGFDGDGLVRFRYDTALRRAIEVERITGLKAWLAEYVIELRGTDRQVGDHVLNIEGLAWDPGKQRLLLGLRAPVIDGQALLVPVSLGEADAQFTRENLRVAGETVRLPLDGAGIRSIEFDDVTGRFRIITGASLNDETLDFKVVEWDGVPGSALVTIAGYDRRLKPEGFVRADIETGSMSVLVFDTSRYLVTR
jgi:hypothetical protein